MLFRFTGNLLFVVYFDCSMLIIGTARQLVFYLT